MVGIIDTTLREGEQTNGVYFSLLDKKNILAGLVRCGIDEIELGLANPDSQDLASLASFCKTRYPQQSFSLWCRCLKEDIRWAATLKPTVLALSIPASDLHLKKKLGKDRDWALEQLQQSIHIGLESGIPKIAIGLEDASRADSDFINQLAQTAEAAGAFRLRLADTVGISSPENMVRMLDQCTFGQMEAAVHCHNDFGMATANTITALEHGAQWGDVTVLGLGERAGNSRLEEVLGYLITQKHISGYRMDRIPELSRLVAHLSAQDISPHRPIIGGELFACETGLHLQGIEKDPTTYEPFDPALVGTRRKISIGQKAGRRSIAATMRRLKLRELDGVALARLTKSVRSLSSELGRPLAEHEFIRLTPSLGACPRIGISDTPPRR
jgi:homocitrate synthase NifV